MSVDEPIGHSLDNSDLFSTFNEVIDFLKEQKSLANSIEKEIDSIDELDYMLQSELNLQDLITCRLRNIKFIVSTHKLENKTEEQELINKLISSYKNKIKNSDWFYINDLISKIDDYK